MKKSIECKHKFTTASPKIMLVTSVRERDGQKFGFFVCGKCYLPQAKTLTITRKQCKLCLGRFLSPISRICKSCHRLVSEEAALSDDPQPWTGWLWLQEHLRQRFPAVSGAMYVAVDEITALENPVQ